MAEALTVGVVVGVTPDRWTRTWAERMPQHALRIVPVTDGATAAALDDGADLVFARLPVADAAALHVIPLWGETPVVVAARDHPVRAFETVRLADLDGEERYDAGAPETLDVVAAGHGVALMPQSVFRATGRRDLVARPVEDAEPTRIALVWRRDSGGPLVDEFIGVVRGRTVNSSRGRAAEPETPDRRRPERRPPPPASRGRGKRRR